MKNAKTIVFTAAIILLGLNSCLKPGNNPQIDDSAVQLTMQQGTWKITLFNDGGTDKTPNFTGYNFTFVSNGTVESAKPGSTINGVWSSGVFNNQILFNLDFGTAAPFNDLNGNWNIQELNPLILRLQQLKGGSQGTDVLVFEKNQ